MLKLKPKNNNFQKELKALTRAERIELRFHQAQELQFRRKYEKYLTRGNFETSLIKKENFIKTAQLNNVSNLQTGEVLPLHKLIYTNGEVDIDKVMCLHLLSVHYLNVASLADKRNLKLFPRRSKSSMIEASALPFYIVEVVHKVNTEVKTKFKENSEVIILVNNNLEKLILSILEVLAIVSPQKLTKIKELSQNKKLLQEIMVKNKICNLLAQVKDNLVFSNPINYRIEVAHYREEHSLNPNILSVCSIKVRDKSNKLEMVKGKIKKTIEHYTEDSANGESWSMCHRKLCSCKKAASKSSIASGNAIALLNDDGKGFAMVTESGCHLPNSSSMFYPSLSAIIKSSPQNMKTANKSSGYLVSAKSPFLKAEQNSIMSSLLHKVSNSQRIMIGKKVAELKTQVSSKKIGKTKMPIKKIMEEVFSKQSLVSFASRTGNEELKLLFQPCCKGGLGIGSFILEPEKKTSSNKCVLDVEQLESVWDYENGVVPNILQQEKSIMHTAQIKQEIFTSETRTKMKLFLLSKNPGSSQPKQ